MKKLFLSGIAALFLATGTAHAREWQGNMPKPIGKLPSYPPVVCVTTNWTPEPCESRQSSAHTDAEEDVGAAFGAALAAVFAWLKWIETNWLGTALVNYRPWDGTWPRRTTIIYDENGGILDAHIMRWKELAASGNNVEVRGLCPSGCTMIMAYVPSDRICFGDNSALGFHMARFGYGENYKTFKPSLETARWMVNQYPQNIRQWVNDRGGAEKMQVEEVWVLDAPTLWQMGYRKCSPEPIDLGDQLHWRERDEKGEELYKEWIKNCPAIPSRSCDLYPHTGPNP